MVLNMILTHGTRYTADITLRGLEALAGNDTVKRKLEDAGFTNVLVGGNGSKRMASGTWGGATREVVLPKQVSTVRVA